MNERPTPSPPAVTPSEVAESLRRAGLSRLNPGQQADFRLGLEALAVLAGRMPRDVSHFLPFGFDFRPDLHAPAPARAVAAPAQRPAAKPTPKAAPKPPPRTAKPAPKPAKSRPQSKPQPKSKAKARR
jgi:cell division septation protein DedD